MITEEVKRFVETAGHAFVATADATGHPHLAAGREIFIAEPNLLVFQAWCCLTTLRNLKENPRVAVAIADPATGKGFQFTGHVEKTEDTALLNGYTPDVEPPEMPQVQWRLEIRVESVMAFSADAHSDRPLG